MQYLRKSLIILLIITSIFSLSAEVNESVALSKTSTTYWTQKTGRKVRKVKKINCKIYHYVTQPNSNKCAVGKINSKTVANNYWAMGRDMYIEGYGFKKVRDRGGKALNSPYKIDVYVPRRKGESYKKYRNRVWNMGVKKRTVYILYFK